MTISDIERAAIEAAIDAAYAHMEHANVSDAVRAAIDAYLAKMPRAWAVVRKAGPNTWQKIHGNDVYGEERDAQAYADGFDYMRAVPIAIVPVKDDTQ